MYSAFLSSNTTDELRSIIASSIDGFLLVDMAGHILETNDSYCQMVGHSHDQLINMRISEIDAIESAEEVGKRSKKIIQFGSLRFETKHLHRDGSNINVEVSANHTPLYGGSFFCFVRDISQQKRTDKALMESERRFRSFIESANDIVFVLTNQGDFTYVSPNWKDAFGYELDETVGKSFVPFVHPDDIANCIAALQKVLETGETQEGVEYRVLHKDGRLIWYSANGSPLHDTESNQVFFLGIGRDITERKKSEEEKLQLERQLLQAQKLESLGIMAGGIAHDFNNLLQSILGNIELASINLAPDSSSKELISNAMVAGKRATHLISLMLAYVGKGIFIEKLLNLNELVRENTDLLKSVATASVAIEVSLTEELPAIMADEAQIQQVVMNLLSNAAEAIENNPGQVKIMTGTQSCDQACLAASLLDDKPEPGRYVFLEVCDNGCGMSKETIDRLFDPFFTTKFTGRGLGMSAVMGIIKTYKGALFVKSELGKGTIFRVLFPVVEYALPPTVVQEPITPPPVKQVITERLLSGVALVVDDEKSVLRTCAKMITLCGFKVITACDGNDAVLKFREHADEICVVLMDLTMPNMDGMTAMKEIYGIRPGVKVILASGFNESELGRRISDQPPAGFIRKPYSMREIMSELQRVMQDG